MKFARENSWESFGLKATGSSNLMATNIQIPEERTFTISPETIKVDGPLYKYPFESFAYYTLAVSFLGMAERFLDEAERIILIKNNVSVKGELSDLLKVIIKNAPPFNNKTPRYNYVKA